MATRRLLIKKEKATIVVILDRRGLFLLCLLFREKDESTFRLFDLLELSGCNNINKIREIAEINWKNENNWKSICIKNMK